MPEIRRLSYEHNYNSFIASFNSFSRRFDPASAWYDLVRLIACSISNAVDKSHFVNREKIWHDTISKYTSSELDLLPELYIKIIEALQKKPEKDFLGEVYTGIGINTHSNGKFFTPSDGSRILAQLTMVDIFHSIHEDGYASISDSACGSGSTLIAAACEARYLFGKEGLNWQNHLLFVAQDINLTAALMCYIQLSLLGAPGYVKIGDTLSNPQTISESPDVYWFTPMYFSEPWQFRRLCKRISLL